MRISQSREYWPQESFAAALHEQPTACSFMPYHQNGWWLVGGSACWTIDLRPGHLRLDNPGHHFRPFAPAVAAAAAVVAAVVAGVAAVAAAAAAAAVAVVVAVSCTVVPAAVVAAAVEPAPELN